MKVENENDSLIKGYIGPVGYILLILQVAIFLWVVGFFLKMPVLSLNRSKDRPFLFDCVIYMQDGMSALEGFLQISAILLVI